MKNTNTNIFLSALVTFLMLFSFGCSQSSGGSKSSKKKSLKIPESFVLQFTNDGTESCFAMTRDKQGNLYCAGETWSDFGEESGGATDLFVMKISPQGKKLWITQLGNQTKIDGGDTSELDNCLALAVDDVGNVYCGGSTRGSLSEGNGGNSGEDAFVLKLNSDGEIVWLTQLGDSSLGEDADTSEWDKCAAIAVDKDQNVYCGGDTEGSLGEGHGGNGDAFVMKLDSSGEIQWITQLGDTTKGFADANNGGSDQCWGVAVDDLGNVYCGGSTDSDLGEVYSAQRDVFVMKLTSNGDLVWITQFGQTTKLGSDNEGHEECLSVAVDKDRNVYCAGYAEGGFGEGGDDSEDAFVLKLNPSGVPLWITQLGDTTKASGGENTGDDKCLSVAVDAKGNVYCAGETSGPLGEVNAGGTDAFVMKLNSSGQLQWLTQLGSSTKASTGSDHSEADSCTGVSVDSTGHVYCAGYTEGILGKENANPGSADVFFLKLKPDGSL